jgi:hypothetical protein
MAWLVVLNNYGVYLHMSLLASDKPTWMYYHHVHNHTILVIVVFDIVMNESINESMMHE